MRFQPGKTTWSQPGKWWSHLATALLLCLLAAASAVAQPMGSYSAHFGRGLTRKFDRNATDGNVTVNYMTPHQDVVIGKPISKLSTVRYLNIRLINVLDLED